MNEWNSNGFSLIDTDNFIHDSGERTGFIQTSKVTIKKIALLSSLLFILKKNFNLVQLWFEA